MISETGIKGRAIREELACFLGLDKKKWLEKGLYKGL